MKKDLRFLQTLILINLLPFISYFRHEYVVYALWAGSLIIIVSHLSYYLLRSIKAGLANRLDSNDETRQELAHFSWNFIIMFFSYMVAGWMIYVSIEYAEII